MAIKKEGKKALNVMDGFFGEWLNNFDLFAEVEQKSLQGIEIQKEAIQTIQDQLVQLEENSKNLITDWKVSVQEADKNQKELYGQNVSDWTVMVEEIAHKSQSLAFSPGKASLDILSNSHAKFAELFISALDQQQKTFKEFTNYGESIVEQIQQTQRLILNPFTI